MFESDAMNEILFPNETYKWLLLPTAVNQAVAVNIWPMLTSDLF